MLEIYSFDPKHTRTQNTLSFTRNEDLENVQQEGSRLPAARSIWEWKTNRTQQYWYCFFCQERFPDQTSHMMHMESEHQLGLSCDCYCLVPSQVWQEDLSGANGDVKERNHILDDSIEVDYTHRKFLIDMSKMGISFHNEEREEILVQRCNLFAEKVEAIRHQLSCLEILFNTKCKLCWTSEVVCSSYYFLLSRPIEFHFLPFQSVTPPLCSLLVS